MKVIVKSTYNENVSSTSSRCSDGHYRQSEYTNSINVYTDSNQITAFHAKILVEFINKHTHHGSDRVWDWSYNGASNENYDADLTKNLIELIGINKIEECKTEEECNVLINPIAAKIHDAHNLFISELNTKQLEIEKEYQIIAEKSKANIAIKTFYNNESLYPINERIPDYREYPLDMAMLGDNIDFLEYLLGKKAKKVQDSYVFASWLCKKGKFEYLHDFIDLSKLKLVRVGDSIREDERKDSWFTEYLLFYTIVNNRLDLFKKYGQDKFNKRITEIYFKEDFSSHRTSFFSVGQVAVKYSNFDVIKNLSQNFYDFYIRVGDGGFYSNKKNVLDENCFRDKETAFFFIQKYTTDSIYALFYWNRTEFLAEIIKSNAFDLSKIVLSSLGDFFTPENNSILFNLASINSHSLIQKPDAESNIATCFNNNPWRLKNSVLENCAVNKNFDLFSILFELCTNREEITGFSACQLLFKICKFDENNEAIKLKELVFQYINEDDVMSLAGTACIENNLNLLRFLIKHIGNINEQVKIEPSSYGNEKYNGLIKSISEEYKKGTLLHLSLVANPNRPGRWLSIELIQILLNAGIDIEKKDASGKIAFDYIKYCYSYRDDVSQRNELVNLLYIDEVNICNKNGELIYLFQDTGLPIVEKYNDYISSGLSPIKAFENNNKDVIDFFISCGADYDTLKSAFEWEKRKKEINNDNSDTEYPDTSYTEQELRDMYRDAFDGFDDAVWNID
ncbi:hypothetical protein [Draconibacterium sp.]|uniref:hypothetical protein n=1 Tax=Draconibacterium sp. TaxID=1965318 RepID=UPI003567E1BA